MWEDRLFSLFEDLEHQAEALYDAERAAELADRGRAEYQQVTLASRLMASVDRDVALEVEGVGRLAGTLQRVGSGWCLVRGAGQDWVLRTAAITLVGGASDRALPEVAWSPVARLGFGSALRRIAEEAERCVVHLRDGRRHEGVLLRVGSDFVEAAAAGETRVLLPFDAIAGVQSRD